ncbi:hypothetical protein BDP81DRAFT_46889 [Colletotrichum phormii]|uniref:Uncharacterized protein n=1 Tax=Colletotrichum phormii TaxID=359342 RepID=A0AAJ0ECV6_9PEZI|nr:uncharacterized protein BDP81DRAFT_46889 [Colletotrichum phormii]KAK1635212.1 hypothetical protein BDP81DRAFT_46889 [Colletotrichum phormii]
MYNVGTDISYRHHTAVTAHCQRDVDMRKEDEQRAPSPFCGCVAQTVEPFITQTPSTSPQSTPYNPVCCWGHLPAAEQGTQSLMGIRRGVALVSARNTSLLTGHWPPTGVGQGLRYLLGAIVLGIFLPIQSDRVLRARSRGWTTWLVRIPILPTSKSMDSSATRDRPGHAGQATCASGFSTSTSGTVHSQRMLLTSGAM